MSGLNTLGGLPGFVTGGQQVAQRDIDQYYITNVDNPAVSTTWHGTAVGTTSGTIAQLQQLCDWPRNLQYIVTGISAGTYGGTLVNQVVDQFGVNITETITIPSAINGGTVYGTAIVAKYLSGSFSTNSASGTFLGTVSVGYGTLSNGSAQSNWFGLLTKVAGTGDVSNIRWSNNGTITGLNKGTNIGTLINTATHSFQGTSGVQLTDTYTVTGQYNFDNANFGTMSNF